MTLETLPDEKILQEAASVNKIGYYESELPDLPLTRLRDRTFEILAHALVTARIEQGRGRYSRATLLRAGADEGRDVLLLDGERIAGIIQCKRYETAITLPMVLRELMRFALRAVRNPDLVQNPDGFGYELWTAGELSGSALAFFDAPQRYILDNRNTLIEAAQKARAGMAGLRIDDVKQAAAEHAAALALVKRFALSTVGPVEIKSRLADHPTVRRRFFRGPHDSQQQATAADIVRLLEDIHLERRPPVSDASPYVPRVHLSYEFERFMASPAQIFAVVGTTGQGKSRWAAQQRSNPPPATRIEVVRGEDIEATDQHVIDTLTRLLRSRRLGSLSEVDLKQAVFSWIDDASHVLIIDGLDRSNSPRLSDWLSQSFALTRSSTTRFVVTSRRIAWSLVESDVLVDPDLIHRPQTAWSGKIPSLGLDLLSDAESAALYVAYGLSAPHAGSRRFRSPGLIALEASVRSSSGGVVGTRAAVLSESLAALQRQLHRTAGIGLQQFAQLVDRLGDLLVDDAQGRIQATRFRGEAPHLVAALDAVIDTGSASVEREQIRIEPDDLIEFLMALRLDPDTARLLVEREGNDLAIGAAGLSIARLEADGHDKVRAAIALFLDSATLENASLTVATRAIAGLKNPELIHEQASAVLDWWRLPNVLLGASSIPLMLDEIELPAIERLQLAMRLAPGEDLWDWRGKYFYDADQAASRFITAFGHVAARMVAADPLAALSFLLGCFDAARQTGHPIDDYESVESGLLYLAIKAAPPDASLLGWGRLPDTWLLERVVRVEPVAAARLFGTAAQDATQRSYAAREIWSLTIEPPNDYREDQALRLALGHAAAALLPDLADPQERVRMLVAILRADPGAAAAAELIALWPVVDNGTFWFALEVLPEKRLELFTARFSGGDHPNRTDYLLGQLPGGLFPVDEWPQVMRVLRDAADNGLTRGAALGLETLLWRAALEDCVELLMPLAQAFAASKVANLRRPLIFFSDGTLGTATLGVMQAREQLRRILVEHEDGANLETLVWKLVQSAPLSSSALPNLSRLSVLLGAAAVDAALYAYREIERDGMRVLHAHWLDLEPDQRPDLPTIGYAG